MAMAADPACGMQVDTDQAKYTVDHGGETPPQPGWPPCCPAAGAYGLTAGSVPL